MHPGQQIGGIPKIPPPRSSFKQERRTDPETVKFLGLFNSLLEKHSRDFIIKYIKNNTIGGVLPIVVERWLNNEHTPSPGICRDVISVLENFRPNIKSVLPFKPKPKLLTREHRWQAIMEGDDEELKKITKKTIEREKLRMKTEKDIARARQKITEKLKTLIEQNKS